MENYHWTELLNYHSSAETILNQLFKDRPQTNFVRKTIVYWHSNFKKMILFVLEVNNWMKLLNDCLHYWQSNIYKEPARSSGNSGTTEGIRSLETTLRILEETLAQGAKLNSKGVKLVLGATAKRVGLEVVTPNSKVERVCGCRQTWAVFLSSITVSCSAQESYGREARKEA